MTTLFSPPPTDESKVIVPPEGDKNARFVIVGEAPGADEARLRRPWVGRAGNLLMQLLNSAGILRRDCYLTNVVKERPPNNDISKFVKFKRTGVEETPEFRRYKMELKEELEQTTANIIIAAGDTSLYALTGMTGITKRRGSIYESTLVPGRKVIPIIHPSSALRYFIQQRYIMLDLMKAVRESEFPKIRRMKRELEVFPSVNRILHFINDLINNGSRVAADIEVVNEEVSHISLSESSRHSMSIAFFKDGKNFYSKEDEALIWQALSRLLESEKNEKLFHNASFDLWFLYRKYGIITHPIKDTMIAMALATPDLPKGLDFVCSVFTDIPYYKDEGKKHLKLVVDDKEFSEYNAKDSIVLHEIMDKLEEDLKRQGNWEYYLDHCKLVYPLTFMQERGIIVDTDSIAKKREESSRRMKEIEDEFRELTGISDFNLNSSTQVRNYFYVQLGIKSFTKSVRQPDGSYNSVATVDEKALKRLAIGSKTRAPRKEAILLLEYRKLSKLSSTYYDLKVDKDGRLRSQFNIVGTKFSRLSSSTNIFGTGENMQNQPESMRHYYKADPGYLLFNVDLSQADWRVVAYLAEDFNMIEALETGKDIHKRTASIIFGIPEDQISDEPGSAPQMGNGTHSQRFWGKKTNHSANYKIGPNELALNLGITLSQAKMIIDSYLRGYPGIEMNFWKWVKDQLSSTLTLTNLFGRSYTFLDAWGSQLLKAAYAYIPQSTVADIINRWGILYIYQRQDLFPNLDLLIQVHDSILFQIPISDGIDKIVGQLKLIKASLERPLECKSRKFVIPCDFKVGLNWGEMEKLDLSQAPENVIKRMIEKGGSR